MSSTTASPTPRRARTWLRRPTVQTLRRLVQLGVVAFIAVVAGRHVVLGDSVPSPEAFCPFGGLETLYRYLSSGGKTISHTHLSNDSLAPDVVCGQHGWWQACPELGAPGYEPFGPDGANFNLLSGNGLHGQCTPSG